MRKGKRKNKTRVFVSYDYNRDKELKAFLIGQSRNERSPFSVSDWSLREAAPQRSWKNKAKERIKQVDKVVVILGARTSSSPGVRAEVDIARSLGKPVIQIKGRKNRKCRSVRGAGRRLRWTWGNLARNLN